MSAFNRSSAARSAYSTLCRALDNDKLKYVKKEEDLTIFLEFKGEDIPIEIFVKIDEGRSLAMLLSRLPFSVSEDKRIEIAVALTAVNNVLAAGCFDLDFSTGDITFRMTNSFLESKISEDVYSYMYICAAKTVEEYNDKLLMLSKGIISMESFLSEFNK